MTRNPSMIRDHFSSHCDGTAGLEFFADDHAFTWTGNLADPVEISPGGYGEPVHYLLDLAATDLGTDLAEILRWFEDVCTAWLHWVETLPEDTLQIPTRAAYDPAGTDRIRATAGPIP